jgi:hypothetical protein
MEKVLSYEEYVRVKNLLTRIKQQLNLYEEAKDVVFDTINEINEIINIDVPSEKNED